MLIYRYLGFEYLKVLFLSVFSFLAILMITRLEEIARFASLGAPNEAVLKFALYQIPYILPIVLPLSGLISGIILTQGLSQLQELTALRASGMSLRQILAAPLLIATFLALLNFYIVSELATESHMKSRMLQRQLTQINPLSLVKNKQLIRHKDLFLTGKTASLSSEKLDHFLIAHWNTQSKRLSLLQAQELTFEEPLILGKQMALISAFGNLDENSKDNIYVENLEKTAMGAEGFGLFIKEKANKIHEDFLKMSLLLTQIQMDRKDLSSVENGKIIKKRLQKAYSEISRRFSIALATFMFTLLGVVYGMHTGRQKTSKQVYVVICLASVYLVSYFVGRTFESKAWLATLFYLLPLGLIFLLSIVNLKRISRGLQ